MRKTVPLAVVGVGALVLATLAVGATRHYKGTDLDPACSPGNCAITFNGKVKKGKVKTVTRFVFKGIPIKCTEGDFTVSNPQAAVNGMKVNKQRRFSGVLNGPNQQRITVRGRFARNWKTAKGTLTDKGNFPPTASNCRTGTDAWTVSR